MKEDPDFIKLRHNWEKVKQALDLVPKPPTMWELSFTCWPTDAEFNDLLSVLGYNRVWMRIAKDSERGLDCDGDVILLLADESITKIDLLDLIHSAGSLADCDVYLELVA
jgi:hypothetical protein